MISQSGRSMVEMLGVLAIIGVLSVGGIAGYKKAMDMHAINGLKNIINIMYVEWEALIAHDPDGQAKIKIGGNNYAFHAHWMITTYVNEEYPFVPKEACSEIEQHLKDVFPDYLGARLTMKNGQNILLGEGWTSQGTCADAVEDFYLSGINVD